MFTKVIDKLYENKHLASKESNNAKLQYEEFINDVVSRYQEDFLDFGMSNDGVAHFFGKFLTSSNRHKDLWKAIQILFVMPNCQAHIERGFSINKMVIENLQSDSLCALRLVWCYHSYQKKELHEIEIKNKCCYLVKYPVKLQACFGGNWKARSDSENDRERQMITEDKGNVKRKCAEFQFCITMLNKDIENCCKEGEEKNEILYFLKANW